jgi:hypothetical protein
MPEISRFFGIVIRMHFLDHHPPHFHAEYAEFEVEIAIRDLEVLDGNLPPRALGLTIEWAAQHQSELLRDWELASNRQGLRRIEPLR